MGFWVLVQVLVNLILFAMVGVMWVRLSRPAKDDPRLSKGLQLLQSKIAVLEDLSDRTETQVSQLTALLETKCREIQEKIVAADRQIAKIDQSALKSLEVAQIFQDRIPHSEILERQNTIKYVKAARMAHQGSNVDDIAREVDLSRAEIEFIAKVNREQLQFSEDDLPAWAREGADIHAAEPKKADSEVKYSLPRENFEAAFEVPAVPPAPKTVAPPTAVTNGQSFMEIDLGRENAAPQKTAPSEPVESANVIRAQTSNGKTVDVRPVSFPRIQSTRV